MPLTPAQQDKLQAVVESIFDQAADYELSREALGDWLKPEIEYQLSNYDPSDFV
jgi:hypothetical protein